MGLQGGAVQQRKLRLLPGYVREPGHHEGLQGVKLVMVDDPRTSATPIFFGNCERTLNRNHHNTFDTLKASMVAGFADIKDFREPRVLLGPC